MRLIKKEQCKPDFTDSDFSNNRDSFIPCIKSVCTIRANGTVKEKRPKMGSLVLNTRITNLQLKTPKLTAVSTFPRNVILINQFGIFWPAPMR